MDNSELSKRETIWERMFERRMPQFLGGYFITSIAIVQFVDWMVKRYLWSASWTDLCIFILTLSMPSYLILIYFHGKPGPDPWTSWEKIGVPTNTVITILLFFMVFSGKSFGKIGDKVITQGEQGQEVVKVIPKRKYRQKLALFFFDNNTGNPDNDWLQHGFHYLLLFDLVQDPFVDFYSAMIDINFAKKTKDLGFPKGTRLPITLQRDIAEKHYMSYFLRGEIKKDPELSIHAAIYKTESSEVLHKLIVSGKDVFSLADKLAHAIKEKLGVPERYDGAIDLPVSDLLTHSENALKYFMQGAIAANFDSDLEQATVLFEKAVAEDPTFAMAHSNLSLIYKLINRTEKMEETMDMAMKHAYKLPDRMQYFLKSQYYILKEDLKSALSLSERMVKLFPEDYPILFQYAFILEQTGEAKKALNAYLDILELQPDNVVIMAKTADTYNTLGKVDKALDLLNGYVDKNPDDINILKKLGNLQIESGNFEEASRVFEQVTLVEPNDFEALTAQADIAGKRGDYDQALVAYQRLYASTTHADEKVLALGEMLDVYQIKGQLTEIRARKDTFFELIDASLSPLVAIFKKMRLVKLLNRSEKFDEAFLLLDRLIEVGGKPYRPLFFYDLTDIYLGRDELEKAIATTESAFVFAESQNLSNYLSLAHTMRGKVFEFQGNFEDAVSSLLRAKELDPSRSSIDLFLARCYRKSGNLDAAKAHIDKVLTHAPCVPSVLMEAALIHRQAGEVSGASGFLDKALEIWHEADLDFQPGIEAREIKKKWESQP